MNKQIPWLLLTLLCSFVAINISSAQVITTTPTLPKAGDEVVVTFDATLGNGGLANYTGDVYAHTGVLVEGTTTWQYVKGTWGNNTTQPKLTRTGTNTYTLTLTPSIKEFYAVPDGKTIKKMCFVFRSSDATKQTEDLFYDVYPDGLTVNISYPTQDSPIFELNDNFNIQASANGSTSLSLYLNNQELATTSNATVSVPYTALSHGTYWVKAIATDGENTVKDSTYFFVRPNAPVADLPAGAKPGVNRLNDNSVTIVLSDPAAKKQFAFLLGSFNNWVISEDYYMNRTPSGQYYWITLTNLEPNTDYLYQFLIDGTLKIADPFCEQISDPWNDKYISTTTYPNLPAYPDGKTTGIASVFRTNKEQYTWQVESFAAPKKTDLVIYELHIRDFLGDEYVNTLTDTLNYLQELGINAIELMPIMEFEGNDSWGYNPSFYFAPDKAYGTPTDYKRFIDECHQRGIAVILDIVLNHSFGQSPFVQMYFDANAGDYGQPTADNPWFNQTCPHQPWCWGYDFNVESTHTQYLFDRIIEYWLTEYKADGFRFDFTKGFTNKVSDGWAYDAARIKNLKRIADKAWSINPNTYIILEHLTDNSEETELASYGMMLWGNMNHAYNEATMGWITNSNFSGVSYKQRGWNVPHLIGYMESHDEERLMYKNLTYGNSQNPNHNVKNLDVALKRNALAATFFFTIPGPKMVWQFGELGYDYSIDENGRVGRKPIRWDYYSDYNRKQLYNTYAQLIRLKTNYEVFETTTFTTYLSAAVKWIKLDGEDMDAAVIGNFNVDTETADFTFPATGKWYEFFTQDSISVTNTKVSFTLNPGEYRLYTTQRIKKGDVYVGIKPIADNKIEQMNIWPNPATSSFTLNFNLYNPESYTVSLVNLMGQKVATLHSAKGYSGANTAELVIPNNIVPNVYLCVVQTGTATKVAKLVVK